MPRQKLNMGDSLCKWWINSAAGVYIPQEFAQTRDKYVWFGVNRRDWRTIERGPDAEWYWEAWYNVLSNAHAVDENGHIWRLWQNGDLYLYRDDCPFDDEGPNPDATGEDDD